MSELPKLRASNWMGTLVFLSFAATTTVGVSLSLQQDWRLWLVGQLMTAVAFTQWFVLLHEAGHNSLFRSRKLNNMAGHIASYFTAIPFYPWRSVHSQHHRWTGWQDRDPTTEGLVPRELKTYERVIIDFCWKFWVPLFSILYRLGNFWNLPRLINLLPRPHHRRRNSVNIALLIVAYIATILLLGPLLCLQLFGLAFLLHLIFSDPILFSQHNHIPQEIAGERDVEPHPPSEQAVFTRSLRFPRWFSACVLLHFDAHELHHIHPHVPGYYLGRLPREETPNSYHWWTWIRAAKRVPASVIMFQNRDASGLDI